MGINVYYKSSKQIKNQNCLEQWYNTHSFVPISDRTVHVRNNDGQSAIAIFCDSGEYSYRDPETNNPIYFYVREWRYTEDSIKQFVFEILSGKDPVFIWEV